MEGRDLLAYLSIKYKGSFELIYRAIKEREKVNEKEATEVIHKLDSKFITILDKEYPESLKRICMPPMVLYYYGDIKLLNSPLFYLGVVGSRDYSKYGENATIKLVKSVAKEKIIVSGLARGIDAIAHKASIDEGGKTIAVLGSGIDYPYPNSNKNLYEIIKKDHLVISEYPGRATPEPNYFPDRNRIIAGLSDKLLVTEAYEKSGTSITVMHTLRQGKDVLVVPYEIDKGSACNKMIQDGAFLVESVEDLKYYTEKKF